MNFVDQSPKILLKPYSFIFPLNFCWIFSQTCIFLPWLGKTSKFIFENMHPFSAEGHDSSSKIITRITQKQLKTAIQKTLIENFFKSNMADWDSEFSFFRYINITNGWHFHFHKTYNHKKWTPNTFRRVDFLET